MKGKVRKYIPSLGEYGLSAEKLVINYLYSLSDVSNVVHLPDGQYGVDLAFNVFGSWVYADVERRNVWKDGQEYFPFHSVNVPERKQKFLIDPCRQPFVYFVVRGDLYRMLVLNGKDILKSPLEMCSKNKEYFYSVPKEKIINYISFNHE